MHDKWLADDKDSETVIFGGTKNNLQAVGVVGVAKRPVMEEHVRPVACRRLTEISI